MTKLKRKTKSLKNERKAINEFQHSLILKDGSEIDAIMLYGSIVSGEYHPKESDIDIMVVVKNRSIDEDILNLETIASLKYGVVISALLMTAKELEEGKKAGYAFFDELSKGRVIYERGKARDKISL